MQIKISNFKSLVNLIEDYDLDQEQIKTLLAQSIGVFMDSVPKKKELIKQLNEYWSKYGNNGERPLFLD